MFSTSNFTVYLHVNVIEKLIIINFHLSISSCPLYPLLFHLPLSLPFSLPPSLPFLSLPLLHLLHCLFCFLLFSLLCSLPFLKKFLSFFSFLCSSSSSSFFFFFSNRYFAEGKVKARCSHFQKEVAQFGPRLWESTSQAGFPFQFLHSISSLHTHSHLPK